LLALRAREDGVPSQDLVDDRADLLGLVALLRRPVGRVLGGDGLKRAHGKGQDRQGEAADPIPGLGWRMRHGLIVPLSHDNVPKLLKTPVQQPAHAGANSPNMERCSKESTSSPDDCAGYSSA